MVDVPTEGCPKHPGVVLELGQINGKPGVKIARGTSTSNRTSGGKPIECRVATRDPDDPFSDGMLMVLSDDTYFYADEIKWFSLKGLDLRKGECPPDFFQDLQDLERERREAETEVDATDAKR